MMPSLSTSAGGVPQPTVQPSHRKPTMSKKRTAQIWIGIFEDNAPEDYFVEMYSDDDDAPLNQFAKEQGETFYDHDWLEVSNVDMSESTDVRSFVSGHSYSDQYVDEVCERARSKGIDSINVFVMCVEEDEFSNPRSATGDGYRLEYLGEFDYEH